MNLQTFFCCLLCSLGTWVMAQQSSYRVTKEYDERGQLIRYDSVRTSSGGHYYSFQQSGPHMNSKFKGRFHIMTDSIGVVSIDSTLAGALRSSGKWSVSPKIFIQHWDDSDSLSIEMQHMDSLMRCQMKAMFQELDAVFNPSKEKKQKTE